MYDNNDFENMSIESLKIIIENLKNKPKHTQAAMKNYLNKLKKDNENKKYIEIMGKNKIMCPIEDCFSTLNEVSLNRHIGEYRAKGSFINHVERFLDIFGPPPPFVDNLI